MPAAPPAPRVVDIDESLVDRVAEFLHENFTRRFDVGAWRNLFTYPWYRERSSSGAALVEGERVVGVLGCVYSQRVIDGRTETFGNICAWLVLPEYRSHSLAMLFHVTRREGVVTTNLTPTTAIEKLFRALNYRVLDTHKLFFFPLLNLPTMARGRALRFVTDQEEIGRALDRNTSPVFHDHRETICRHLLAISDEGQCYVLFRRRVKKLGVFAEALHISDPDFFARHLERFVWRMLLITRAPALAVDSRFLAGHRLLSLPIPRTSYYTGDSLDPSRIDNAYTELAVFPV